MSLIDLISSEEKEIIDYFRDGAATSAGYENSQIKNTKIPVENWLIYWDKAKHNNHIDTVFGKSLILKKQYKYYEDQDTITDLMYDNICRSSDFIHLKYAIVESLKDDDRNISFISGYTNILSRYIMNAGPFAANTYKGPKTTVYFSDGKTFTLSPGSKIMKDLGVLAKHCDQEEVFERIRIAHSQILNESSFNCNLCLSIHPLDYITASFNENNWRSCMCWGDGDYCRGVVEMMNSPCVIVAYIESNHEYVSASNHKWNSKKWREFFIVDENVLCGIKGYPYWNRTIEEFCLSWLRDLFNPFYNYEEEMCLFNGEIRRENKKININFNCGPAMYNDFCHGDYRMFLSKNFISHLDVDDENYGYFELNYSGVSECVICGDPFGEFEETCDLCCLDCVEKIRCTCCNEIIYGDVYEVNGEYYCGDCFYDLPTCNCCGSRTNSQSTLYFVSDEFFETFKDENEISGDSADHEIITENNRFSICNDCFDRLNKDFPNKIKKINSAGFPFWFYEAKCAPLSLKPQIVKYID